MKHYFPSSKHKNINIIINTIIFILFIILVYLITRNASEKAVRNNDILSINFNLSGPERQFVIENAELPYFPEHKKEVLNQKIDLKINQNTKTVIITVKDSAWKKGYLLSDSATLPPLDPNKPVSHLFFTIGYDSITNIQSQIKSEPGGIIENRKSIFNNIWFISLLIAISLIGILYKGFYLLRYLTTKKADSSSPNPINIENVNPPNQDFSHVEKENNKIFEQISDVIESIIERKNKKEAQIEEIPDKQLRKILLKTEKTLTEKEGIAEDLDTLEKSVSAIYKNKQVVFPSSLSNELNTIQSYYNQGKELQEICKKLGLSSPSAKNIELYINGQLQSLQQQAIASDQQCKLVAEEKAKSDKEIVNLKQQLEEAAIKINALVKKSEDRDKLAKHLFAIMSKFENDIMGSNSNIMTETEYRQYILPKLIEITFYSIDFIKWYNEKQNFNEENLKVLKEAEHGNITIPVVDDSKIIREINTRKNEAIFNKLIPILKGEDLAEGNNRKAENPKVFIRGRKLEIE